MLGYANNPIFRDVSYDDPASLDRLAGIVKDWFKTHPGCRGFHCELPNLAGVNGPVLITSYSEK